VESDLFGLHFAVFNINFVAYEHNWDVLAYTGQIFVPFGHIRVSDTGTNVKHDDTTVTTDVISVTETTELFLTCGVPNVELDLTMVCEEGHGVDFDTESGNVLLFELTSQVTLDKGSLAGTTVTDKDKLEFWDLLLLVNHLALLICY